MCTVHVCAGVCGASANERHASENRWKAVLPKRHVLGATRGWRLGSLAFRLVQRTTQLGLEARWLYGRLLFALGAHRLVRCASNEHSTQPAGLCISAGDRHRLQLAPPVEHTALARLFTRNPRPLARPVQRHVRRAHPVVPGLACWCAAQTFTPQRIQTLSVVTVEYPQPSFDAVAKSEQRTSPPREGGARARVTCDAPRFVTSKSTPAQMIRSGTDDSLEVTLPPSSALTVWFVKQA